MSAQIYRCCECGAKVPVRVEIKTTPLGIVTETGVGRCRLHPDAKRYSEGWKRAQWDKIRAAVGLPTLAEQIAAARANRPRYQTNHAGWFLAEACCRIEQARKAVAS